MLAIRIHETGGAEKLRADDVPVPAPGAGEIRLRVEAAGVNFIDTYKRSGLYAVKLPHTLGQDVREWVARHPIIAPTAYIAAYVVIGALGFPVWWLQVLGGYGFGLVFGVIWSMTGAFSSSQASMMA